MAVKPFEQANFNLISFSEAYNNLFDSTPKDVQIDLKDTNGNVVTKTIANRGKFKQQLWDDVGGALGQFNKTFYVDATNGNDTNDGSSAYPFKTIKKACDSVPVGGVGNITILGDYTLQQDIGIQYKHINLTPKGTLTFPWFATDATYAGIHGITLHSSSIYFYIDSKVNGKVVVLGNNTGKTSINPVYSSALRVSETAEYGHIKFMLWAFQDNYNPIIIRDGALVSISQWSINRPDLLSIAISGHYTGTNRSIQVNSGAYLVNFESTPSSFYYNYNGGLTDLLGNSININSVVTGVIKDSNGVPRNIISNMVF